MALIQLRGLYHHIGTQTIFDNAEFQLDPGERVCLLGRNGSGKSTLLRLINGELDADKVERQHAPASVAMMEQALPQDSGATVFEAVAAGLPAAGEALSRYHSLTQAEPSESNLAELAEVQGILDANDGWNLNQRVETLLSRLQLDAEALIADLSGGWQRRVSLARALVGEPQVLLLDEPSNHLDLQAIAWLEQAVLDFRGAVLFVTHDRALINKLATRIVELDRGELYSYPGNYQKYLDAREERLRVEVEHNALFDKRLAEEERWIRQGIKARRTRNEGRVRALKQMRVERAQRKEQQGSASMQIQSGQRSGKLVAELSQVNYRIAGKTLVRDFDCLLSRGDKLALVGPNGVGKTTLLKLLLGELQPDSGKLKLGTNVQIAYFDQARQQLDPQKTVADVVGQGRDSIDINGKSRHIVSYLNDFLFTPERSRSQVGKLSGGERARVQLAVLFSQPANVLVMDEPTNDLDIETLELLEELLLDYDGTVLLVSHDRAFIDNIAASCLLFEGMGKISDHVGGYSDIPLWARRALETEPQQKKAEEAEATESSANNVASGSATEGGAQASSAPVKAKKLSYKLQRELDGLPDRIAALEEQLEALAVETGGADFYQQDRATVDARLQVLADTQAELDSAMERWIELADE